MKAEEDELLTLGGKTRLVARKSSSAPSSRAGTDPLASSSPRENSAYVQGDTGTPPRFTDSPALAPGISLAAAAVDSPMSEWQTNWGAHSSSPAYPYSSFQQLANTQYVDNIPGAVTSHSPQYSRPSDPRTQHQQQQPWMMNMDPSPSIDHNMFGSSLGAAMMPYEYAGQQQLQQISMPTYAHQPLTPIYPSPPTNDFHRDWQLFLEHTMES